MVTAMFAIQDKLQIHQTYIQLTQGDITRFAADAICNAANEQLRGGGGVDGAIHRAGGPSIMEELKLIRTAQGGCRTGSAAVTKAGALEAKWVFHAVGPIYQSEKTSAPLLRSAYRCCMEFGFERRIKSIAFPSISTGVYGYPVQDAAFEAIDAIRESLNKNATTGTNPNTVTFVLFDDRTLQAFRAGLGQFIAK